MEGKFESGKSKTSGGVTEVALMTSIIPGRIPGERRTYEERLKQVLSSTQSRAERGFPTAITEIPTIHFARWLIIRPEHYLLHSNVNGIQYHQHGLSALTGKPDGSPVRDNAPRRAVVKPLDPYKTITHAGQTLGQAPPGNQFGLRSWLMTLILFDGDVKVYGREIAGFIEYDVDRVFENCDDYPYAKNFPAWWTWFRRHQLNTDVFQNAYPDISVARIKELELFKSRFDDFLARVRPHNGKPLEPMDAMFDEFVRETQAISKNFPSLGGDYKPPEDD